MTYADPSSDPRRRKAAAPVVGTGPTVPSAVASQMTAKLAAMKQKRAANRTVRLAKRQARVTAMTAKNPKLGARLQTLLDKAKARVPNPSSAAQNNTGVVGPRGPGPAPKPMQPMIPTTGALGVANNMARKPKMTLR